MSIIINHIILVASNHKSQVNHHSSSTNHHPSSIINHHPPCTTTTVTITITVPIPIPITVVVVIVIIVIILFCCRGDCKMIPNTTTMVKEVHAHILSAPRICIFAITCMTIGNTLNRYQERVWPRIVSLNNHAECQLTW